VPRSWTPTHSLEPLTTTIADSLSPVGVLERLLSGGAALAALLAATGIYAVLSHWVSSRRRELGVRFALGASAKVIAGLVVREAAQAAVVGTAVGLLTAIPILQIAGGSLLGLPSLDAPAIGVVVLTTFALTVAASLTPALRAARVDVAALMRLE